MKPTAARVATFGPSVFAEMTRLALTHGAVNLGQGFPDFPPPLMVQDALRDAAAPGHHQYTPPAGLSALREALARTLAPTLGFQPDPDTEITITLGATEAMHAATQALVEHGDEVILIEPCYDMYLPQVQLAGGVVRSVPLDVNADGWTLDLDRLRRACTARTKLLILNTPHNPTGKVFTDAELAGIATLAQEFDFYVLTDEVYDRLAFDRPHRSIASLPGMRERTVTAGSAGKTFAITGWRVGWAIANPQVSAALRGGHQFVTFAAPTPLQAALVRVLGDAERDGYYADLRADYARRRDKLTGALRRAGLPVWNAEGGYFVVADTSGLGADALTVAQRFVTDIGVAGIPMSVFSLAGQQERAPSAMRFAFCKSDATLDAAAERLAAVPGQFSRAPQGATRMEAAKPFPRAEQHIKK